MNWTALESKMLSAAAYDHSKQILYLRFRNAGDVYRYFGFPAADYHAFPWGRIEGPLFPLSHPRSLPFPAHGQASCRLITPPHSHLRFTRFCGEDLLAARV
jgi:hypothetical protein